MPVRWRLLTQVFNVENTSGTNRPSFDLRECELEPSAAMKRDVASSNQERIDSSRGRTTGNEYREQLSFSVDMHVKAICRGACGAHANSYYAERISRFTGEGTGCRATSLIDFLSEK